ncbi:hypothetical protein GCM10007385_23840 [Tateyamaria omphalii]|uniref:hypothetical protein n=1 Tax=Tateyamaria omphalii TaxID=299262 RepID=UPI001674E420|nr:hypothetical protein [Tateyamaria omphalii]GGX54753.1 hypothetical protein GCM10007385_23840 [Tateyamaria omphalii]
MMRLAVALLFAAAPAIAQDRLTPEQFLDLVADRTASFATFPDRQPVGIEQFLSRDRTVWARANGTCAFGLVTAENGQVCFDYDDDPPGVTHCWVPFLRDARLFVASTDDLGEVQEVVDISDDPVACTQAPMS